MSIFGIFAFMMMLCPIGFVLIVAWFIREAFWYNQRRWVVWYPPHKLPSGFRAEAAWTKEAPYRWCKNYASIFNGKVYRVR